MPRSTLLFIAMALLGTAWSAAAGQPNPKPLVPGDVFPRLEAAFLSGRAATLPDAARGRLALVMMGFTYNSRFEVEQWVARLQGDIKPGPDLTWFEVPVIGGMGRMAKWFIDSGMRRGTPEALRENVITVYGEADRWKAAMGFEAPAENDAYLALLDREGRVRWLRHGAATDEAVAALKAAIDESRD